MHATVEQLLSFRDGSPLAPTLQRHIVECSRCRAAMEDLVSLKKGVRDLRDLTPPDGTWERIRREAPAAVTPESVPNRLGSWAIGLAACVALAVGILLASSREAPDPPRQKQSTAQATTDSHFASEDLLARSREMEAYLRRLPVRPRVVRVGTAVTIAHLEESIRLVDYQLNLQREIGSSQSQSQQLWETRVDLLNSLANVRYVEAQRRIY